MKIFRQVLVFSLVFVAWADIVGQADETQARMYLLMTSSEDHIHYWGSENLNPIVTDTTRPAVLYTLSRGVLEPVDTINYNHRIGSIMPECRHFESFKFFYIREQKTRGKWYNDKSGTYYFIVNEDSFVSVLDYSADTIVLRKAAVDSIIGGCRELLGQAYCTSDLELEYTFSKCNGQKNYDRNVVNKFLEVSNISEQTFMHGMYSKAESSLHDRSQKLAGYPLNKEGEMVLNFDADVDIEQWRKADFQFPYKVDSKRYFSVAYLLKSPFYDKEVAFKRRHDSYTDSITTYYLYNKKTKALDSISLRYKILGMNIYQTHTGYGALIFNPKYTKNKVKDMTERSRYSNRYGIIPSLQYNTGGFYLWDLRANEFKTYFFDDLDTELLSIHEEWVYLRVFDEIRRIRLSDLDSADYTQKAEVMYKDAERVPHIHHVFWAPKMPFKVEYVTGRGG